MDKDAIQQDLKESMKARDEARTGTLRMLLAAVFNKEKEKQYALSKKEPTLSGEALLKKIMLTEEEIIGVVAAEVKKRKEAALEFQKGKRQDLASKELVEEKILMNYLPPQLSERELRALVKEAVQKSGASSVKDMGKVMGLLAAKTKGRADGAMISQLVREVLQ